MDYKDIVRSRSARIKIMRLLSFVPDKVMVKLQYRMKTGRKLNLKNPKRYTEKLQWYKLNYRDPLMTQCSDKYDVRDYVVSKGYGMYLNKLIGDRFYTDAYDIDFNQLPNQFVIKATHGSGTNLIVFDKSTADIDFIQKQANMWLKTGGKSAGREWGYENIKPKLIIEKLLEGNDEHDLPDYKFFCFNGRAFCLYVMQNYTIDHSKGVLGFFDRDFRQLPTRRLDFNEMKTPPPKPYNFKKMVEIAEALAEGFPHVRVDFYNIKGEIIFGEMTFYNASGYTSFRPDEFDFTLGEQFILQRKENKLGK